jgi:hypothetical protein
MLTSKNFLWLGFFTTLLFLTFCVTFNLDKLNPNIVNITPEELDQREVQTDENQTYLSEKENKDGSPQFTIIKVSKKENTYINVVDKFNTESLVKENAKKIEKNIIQTAQEERDQETKEKEEEKYTKIIENKNFSFHKKLTTKQKHILNRLAYKTKLAKNSAIFIKTSDINIEDKISNYLQQIGLEKSKIKIDQSSDKNKRVNLSLRKRG